MNKNSIRIKLTPSRLDKGLLAIPKRYEHLFPNHPGKINVFLGKVQVIEQKKYTPYKSSANECRIYGLRDWFEKLKAQSGDWVELSVLDVTNAKYRIVFRNQEKEEKRWRKKFQKAQTEMEAKEALKKIARAKWQSQNKVALKELQKLAKMKWERKRVAVKSRERYEGVPPYLRTLLKTVYKGRCQICSFTFNKCNGKPYFEIHHVESNFGHQPQNLLLLCPNCHAEMEHTNVELERDHQEWVIHVIFNGERKAVIQMLRGVVGPNLLIILMISMALNAS